MAVYALMQGDMGDAFGTALPPSTPTPITLASTGTMYAVNALAPGSQIQFHKYFPGTKPAACTLVIEVCDADPTVAANWTAYQTTTDISGDEVITLPNLRASFIRAKCTVLTTPANGVAGVFSAR
jgi:hypothetical protein